MKFSEKDGDILGYYDDGKPIIQPRGYIYTCAFILCSECKTPISGYGGPAYGSLCVPCHDKEKK